MATQQFTLEQQRVVQAVYGFAADLMHKGSTNHEIETALRERGLTPEAAEKVVINLNRARTQAQRDAALRSMALGAVVAFVGILVTAVTYSAAAVSPSGGSYLVAYGAIMFGGLQFLRGLWRWMQR